MKLLLVEDERSLSRALVTILEKNKYTVEAVYDGEDALYYLESEEYDGVILDWMLPKKDGISVLREMRQRGDRTPVLLLTARAEIDDKVEGLDGGANDYLTKPFDPKELLARIRVMTRSLSSERTDSRLQVGNLTLDCASFDLTGPQGSCRLANKEFQMMELLMRNPRQLIPTERFLERIWGYDSDAEVNIVWVYLSYLRKKLKSVGADVRIRAQRNSGYCLEEIK